MDRQMAGHGPLSLFTAGFASPIREALVAVVLAAVAVVVPGWTRPVPAALPPGEYIVTVEDGIDAKTFAAAADARSGVEVLQVYSVALRAFHARLTPSAKAQLAQDPGVRFVSPNRTFKASAQVLPTGSTGSRATSPRCMPLARR